MKIAAAYVLYDDTELLELSLETTLKACDKIYFLVNKKPWNNAKEDDNNDKAVEYLYSLAKTHSKIHVEVGTWKTEHDTRNHGLELCKKEDMDYCLIIDSDEV